MTDHDLATLVREHVRRDEPPFLMSPDTVIAVGRRTLVRRRARRGFAGIVVAAAAVAALPLMPWSGSGGEDKTGIDPATAAALRNYDAQRMPALIDSHVRQALGHGLDGLGAPEFTASDDQSESLPATYYDKASSMELRFGGDGDRRVRVALMHSRSEAEGDARKNCANDVAEGYAFSCTVTTAADGNLVTTSVMAVRKLDIELAHGEAGWSALTRDELRTGVPSPGDPSGAPIDPAEVYFMRSVESVHSETFLTAASETVRAPDLTTAESRWQIPPEDLARIVTDPELVMPKPPLGKGGCAWTWHADVTCAKDPDADQN
jgi:hypothetical protein